MACDGMLYNDGTYYTICSKEKVKRSFWGIVRMTETGRVVAEGQCDGTGPVNQGQGCGTLLTKVLCTG